MNGTKKEALEQFNRDAILDAAQRLFARRGAAQTTVDDIAREAEYSKSTLYIYFENKEDIRNHILLRSMRRLLDDVNACIGQGGSVRDCFFAIGGLLARCAWENPDSAEDLLGPIGVGEQELAGSAALRELYRVGEEVNDSVSGLLRRGIESGELRPGLSPVRDGLALWAAISGEILLAQNKQEYLKKRLELSREEFLDAGLTLLWHTIAGEVAR